MPLKIIHHHHTEVMGSGRVLLSSPHVESSRRDLQTRQIVEEAALLSKSWAIIAKEGKQPQEEDKARLEESDFDKSVQALVGENGIKCILMISGMDEAGIAIKSHQNDSESGEILEIIRSGFEPHFTINPNAEPAGHRVASSLVNNQETINSSNHPVQIIQLELGPDERGFQKDHIVSVMADIVGLINGKLGFLESDQRGSRVLD